MEKQPINKGLSTLGSTTIFPIVKEEHLLQSMLDPTMKEDFIHTLACARESTQAKENPVQVTKAYECDLNSSEINLLPMETGIYSTFSVYVNFMHIIEC